MKARSTSAAGHATARSVLGPAVVAGVHISHPERVVFPGLGFTKLDLARLYERLAPWILPHLAGRPLTLLRCPDGAGAGCAYMRHEKAWTWPALRRVRIQEKHKVGEYMIADDLAGLISLVQMDVLEMHTWNSRAEDVERPDRIVLDLDPGPRVSWPATVAAAHRLRAVLETLGMSAFVKLTGGTGLHVVTPLVPAHDWSECLELARAIAELLARDDAETFTTRLPKAGRESRILIDYLRNNRTNTSVAAFSTRARDGGPLSLPVRWEELTVVGRSDRFHVGNAERRLARLRTDPWQGYDHAAARIPRGALDAIRRLAR